MADHPSATAGREPSRRYTPVRLLVVEPDRHLLAAICRGLHHAGLIVSGVTTGTEALRCLELDGIPDLLLIDLGLKDTSSQDVLTAADALAGRPLPAAFLSRRPCTASPNTAGQNPSHSQGLGVPVLAGPFGTDRLLALLDDLLLSSWLSAPPPARPGRIPGFLRVSRRPHAGSELPARSREGVRHDTR